MHNSKGKQVDTLEIDEKLLGSEVRSALLKQAYVRVHANVRQGSAATRNRSQVEGSTKKLYRQKGTGNARHGPRGVNLMRGGGHAHAKRPKLWRHRMPKKMRRLANRNAVLAKAVDGEIKLVDGFSLKKPNTKQFISLLEKLKIDRTCLVALGSDREFEAKSASNIKHVTVASIDRLNVFEILNHRYLLAEKSAMEAWIQRVSGGADLADRKEAG